MTTVRRAAATAQTTTRQAHPRPQSLPAHLIPLARLHPAQARTRQARMRGERQARNPSRRPAHPAGLTIGINRLSLLQRMLTRRRPRMEKS